MMKTKLFEVRDRGTLMPAMATLMQSDDLAEGWLLMRAGFGPASHGLVVLAFIEVLPDQVSYDPIDWGHNPRTRQVAHQYITEHWDELKTGAVIDIEYILGESEKAKTSEREA